MFAGFLSKCHNSAEKQLLIVCEDVFLTKVPVTHIRAAMKVDGHHDQILLPRMCEFQSLANMVQRVVVANQTKCVAGTDAYGFKVYRLFQMSLKLIQFHMSGTAAPSPIVVL